MKENEKVKLRAKVVFEWEYETKPENYSSEELPLEEVTIEDMIIIDRNGFEDDSLLFLDCCKNIPTLELTEVKSEEKD